MALGVAIPLLLTVSPSATLISAAWMLGVYAGAAGVLLVAHALRLRRRKEAERPSG